MWLKVFGFSFMLLRLFIISVDQIIYGNGGVKNVKDTCILRPKSIHEQVECQHMKIYVILWCRSRKCPFYRDPRTGEYSVDLEQSWPNIRFF